MTWRSRFHTHASIALTFSLVATSLDAQAQADDIGTQVGNILGNIIGGVLGVGSYKQNPLFQRNVAPYVIDMNRFDAFMAKYANRQNLSEKDGVDIIIALGILKNRPDWITKSGAAVIEKYYPGVTRRHADVGYARLASNDNGRTVSDGRTSINTAGAAAAVPLIVLDPPAAAAAMAIMAVGLFGVLLYESVKLLTPKGKADLQSSQTTLCASPGMSCTSAPAPSEAAPPASPDIAGDVDCSRVIQDCQSGCAQQYAYNKHGLPGTGKNFDSRIRICIRKCAFAQGCSY